MSSGPPLRQELGRLVATDPLGSAAPPPPPGAVLPWRDAAPALALLAHADDPLLTDDPGVGLALAAAGRQVLVLARSPEGRAVAALHLALARRPASDALQVLGLAPFGRRLHLYRALRAELPEDARAWWDRHQRLLRSGLAGAFEVELGRLHRLLGLPVAGPHLLARLARHLSRTVGPGGWPAPRLRSLAHTPITAALRAGGWSATSLPPGLVRLPPGAPALRVVPEVEPAGGAFFTAGDPSVLRVAVGRVPVVGWTEAGAALAGVPGALRPDLLALDQSPLVSAVRVH